MNLPQFTNRLAKETSPYLLQHAHNPVDWYPWGPEALAEAKRAQKPIFLSIGYSACHWCHVMEHESFEDPHTAKIMNELFVNIKVDREERPDLDQIYMMAVQLMTQHGGWPMSVWLTPDLKPFYGGTYFPPVRRYNMPAFREVLLAIDDAWKNRRDQLTTSSEEMLGHLQRMTTVVQDKGPLDSSILERAAEELSQMIDRTWGGIGHAPKFPHSVELRLLLRCGRRLQRPELTEGVAFSLEMMIRGGIYDHLGGGFHRYSTDERWLVPHFEKMLYDNALIPLACMEAWQATGRQIFRDATIETLDYVLREMTSPEGGFYSTQDADSEGEEGKFFVWSRSEIEKILGPENGKTFCIAYDVTDAGNWEGKNILHLPKPLDEVAGLLRMSVEELRRKMHDCRRQLYVVRTDRIAPARDEKILTAWNGMMVDSMATASMVLGEERYLHAALRAAEFLLRNLRAPEGLLLRTYKDGQAKLNGYLEDYAFLANGLVSLYEATFDIRWLREAAMLVDVMHDQFWDEKDGGFFFTGVDHEALIARGKDPQDGATPSGNSMAVVALIRLSRLTDRNDYLDWAEKTMSLFRSIMTRSSMATAQMLLGLGMHLGPCHELILAGDTESSEFKQIREAIHRRYLPDKVVAASGDSFQSVPPLPILDHKVALGGRPTLYVCSHRSCNAPQVGIEAILAELDRLAVPGAS
ncbi:MAG: thioredoxin domain-containing protein [Planctomycetota bacterium]